MAVRVNNQEQILTPGERAILTDNALEKETIENTAAVDWLEGIYRFENATLSEIMNSVQRQFDYEIELPAELSQLKFTGLYRTNNIDEAMYQITWPLNLNYTLDGKRIVVKK